MRRDVRIRRHCYQSSSATPSPPRTPPNSQGNSTACSSGGCRDSTRTRRSGCPRITPIVMFKLLYQHLFTLIVGWNRTEVGWKYKRKHATYLDVHSTSPPLMPSEPLRKWGRVLQSHVEGTLACDVPRRGRSGRGIAFPCECASRLVISGFMTQRN